MEKRDLENEAQKECDKVVARLWKKEAIEFLKHDSDYNIAFNRQLLHFVKNGTLKVEGLSLIENKK